MYAEVNVVCCRGTEPGTTRLRVIWMEPIRAGSFAAIGMVIAAPPSGDRDRSAVSRSHNQTVQHTAKQVITVRDELAEDPNHIRRAF